MRPLRWLNARPLVRLAVVAVAALAFGAATSNPLGIILVLLLTANTAQAVLARRSGRSAKTLALLVAPLGPLLPVFATIAFGGGWEASVVAASLGALAMGGVTSWLIWSETPLTDTPRKERGHA
jgi:hypothetical protein